MGLLFALLNPLNFDEMCIVTNQKYIITVCYDVIILYNFLPMHSFFFPLVYTLYCSRCFFVFLDVKAVFSITDELSKMFDQCGTRILFTEKSMLEKMKDTHPEIVSQILSRVLNA